MGLGLAGQHLGLVVFGLFIDVVSKLECLAALFTVESACYLLNVELDLIVQILFVHLLHRLG